MHKTLITLSLVSALAACQSSEQQVNNKSVTTSSTQEMITEGIKPNLSAIEITQLCEQVLNKTDQDFAALEQQTVKATLASVVGSFDSITDGMSLVVMYGISELFTLTLTFVMLLLSVVKKLQNFTQR